MAHPQSHIPHPALQRSVGVCRIKMRTKPRRVTRVVKAGQGTAGLAVTEDVAHTGVAVQMNGFDFFLYLKLMQGERLGCQRSRRGQRLACGVEVEYRGQGHRAGGVDGVGQRDGRFFPGVVERGQSRPARGEFYVFLLQNAAVAGFGAGRRLQGGAEVEREGEGPPVAHIGADAPRHGVAAGVGVNNLPGVVVIGDDLVGKPGVKQVDVDIARAFAPLVYVAQVGGEGPGAFGAQVAVDHQFALSAHEGVVFGEEVHHAEARAVVEPQGSPLAGFEFEMQAGRYNKTVFGVVVQSTRAQGDLQLWCEFPLVCTKPTASQLPLRASTGSHGIVVVITLKARQILHAVNVLAGAIHPGVLQKSDALGSAV